MVYCQKLNEYSLIQKEIISRANYSLAILGMGFVYHGSGHFLNIKPSNEQQETQRKRSHSIEDKV